MVTTWGVERWPGVSGNDSTASRRCRKRLRWARGRCRCPTTSCNIDDGGVTFSDGDGDAGCTASHATTHLADFAVKGDCSSFLGHVQESPDRGGKKGFVFRNKKGGGKEKVKRSHGANVCRMPKRVACAVADRSIRGARSSDVDGPRRWPVG